MTYVPNIYNKLPKLTHNNTKKKINTSSKLKTLLDKKLFLETAKAKTAISFSMTINRLAQLGSSLLHISNC